MGLRRTWFCVFLNVLLMITSYEANGEGIKESSNTCSRRISSSFMIRESSAAGNNSTSRRSSSSCDIFQGRWVFDNSYPLYNLTTCPFIRREFNCIKYGRPDSLYLKYRWQPSYCTSPRFDGKDFLTRFKGKKIMFVGDSESQLLAVPCLPPTFCSSSGKDHPRDYKHNQHVYHSGLTAAISRKLLLSLTTTTLQMQYVQMHPKMGLRSTWQQISKDMDRMLAFRLALTTWAKWVASDVNSTKTKVFLQGIFPSDYNGHDLNQPGIKSCSNQTEPLLGCSYPAGLPSITTTVKDVLSNVLSKNIVHLLDTTTLSQLRKDAHPSAFNGFKNMDCTHWCLPGLPDTWNQLLYAQLSSLFP